MPQKSMCATCQQFDVCKEYEAGIPATYPGRARIDQPPNTACGTCRRFPLWYHPLRAGPPLPPPFRPTLPTGFWAACSRSDWRPTAQTGARTVSQARMAWD